jgi:hypothetical protein
VAFNPTNVSGDTLSRIASLVTVRDIFTPFVASFDVRRSVADVSEEWSIELSSESPLDQMALVLSDGKPLGLLTYDALEAGKSLSECVDEIRLDMLVTEDTPLGRASQMFADSERYYFVVIRGNEFVGWLSYHDLYKLPYRLCLFAELLSIEERMLFIIQRAAADCFSRLPGGRKEAAHNLYRWRGYKPDTPGDEAPHLLVTCTNFIDKATMLQRSPWIEMIPAASEKKRIKLAEGVRNKLAHPGPGPLPLVERENFGPFLDWLDQLGAQLNGALSAESVSTPRALEL